MNIFISGITGKVGKLIATALIVDKSLKKLHVYIIGNVTNKLIDDWFNQNMNSLTEEFIIEKKI